MVASARLRPRPGLFHPTPGPPSPSCGTIFEPARRRSVNSRNRKASYSRRDSGGVSVADTVRGPAGLFALLIARQGHKVTLRPHARRRVGRWHSRRNSCIVRGYDRSSRCSAANSSDGCPARIGPHVHFPAGVPGTRWRRAPGAGRAAWAMFARPHPLRSNRQSRVRPVLRNPRRCSCSSRIPPLPLCQ